MRNWAIAILLAIALGVALVGIGWLFAKVIFAVPIVGAGIIAVGWIVVMAVTIHKGFMQ